MRWSGRFLRIAGGTGGTRSPRIACSTVIFTIAFAVFETILSCRIRPPSDDIANCVTTVPTESRLHRIVPGDTRVTPADPRLSSYILRLWSGPAAPQEGQWCRNLRRRPANTLEGELSALLHRRLSGVTVVSTDNALICTDLRSGRQDNWLAPLSVS
jgi:hypothetical protein